MQSDGLKIKTGHDGSPNPIVQEKKTCRILKEKRCDLMISFLMDMTLEVCIV